MTQRLRNKIRAILSSGSFKGYFKSVSGYPLTLRNVKGNGVISLSVTGKSSQAGTPSPNNHVEVLGVGDAVGEKYAVTVNVSGDMNEAFNVYVDEPLRAINGYADVLTVNVRKKSATVKRYIRSSKLSVYGTSTVGSADDTIARFSAFPSGRLQDSDRSIVQVLADGLTGMSYSNYTSSATKTQSAITGNTSNAAVFYKLPLELVGESTVAAAKAYLESNPITVYYIGSAPVETDVSDLQDWDAVAKFKGADEIIISVSSGVVPDMLEAQYYSETEVE